MKFLKIFIPILAVAVVFSACDPKKDITDGEENTFEGLYCTDLDNIEMIITQTDGGVTFSLEPHPLTNAAGVIDGDTLRLTAVTPDLYLFSSTLVFSEDRENFSGPFTVTDSTGFTSTLGILTGSKGECPQYDILADGIPQFAEHDFTQLSKIKKISKFRSGFGHSFTDGNEECRSMKHYYDPFDPYRLNQNVEIYSPVDGTILSVSNDGHGISGELTNKQIRIRPDDQPAFIFVLFHCDLASRAIVTGKKVQAGEHVGYARIFYEDLNQVASSFDIAVWVNTPDGSRLVSYFETLNDTVFNDYITRGAVSRQDFIISKESRNADPVGCDGETFLTPGTLENYFMLQ